MSTIEDDLQVTRRVGAAVRQRREELALSLRALAAKSGISSSMISDIERGAKSPTISTLHLIARALATPISSLIDEHHQAAKRIYIVRVSDRPEAVDSSGRARHDRIGPAIAGSRLEITRYAIPPHASAGPFAAHPAGTLEHLYVASGQVRVAFGAESATLSSGDSCTCIADAEHEFDNRHSGTEAVLFVIAEAS